MHFPGFFDYHAKNLLPKDGSLEYLFPFYNEAESEFYFQKLFTDTNWIQDEMEIYEKVHPLPRLISWISVGDTWSQELIEIKKKVEEFTGLQFNTVLLNLYRNERDHVSWHSDRYKHTDDVKNIVSITFGETRKFQVKHKFDKSLSPISIDLMSGSMLIMKDMQQKWLHRVALTTAPKGPRINLTFRNIQSISKQVY